LEAIRPHAALRTRRLRVVGHVEQPPDLSMEDLCRMEVVSLVAVKQCPRNSRSLFAPRVPGGEWVDGR
jgi:DMSO/TMAO reductase YedYZ molybdopterin-dependent catalytic subunit